MAGNYERLSRGSAGHGRDLGERGLVSVWTAVAMVAFIVIIGIGVDFSGHARMSQEARAVADEAARAGGQQLQITSGRARPEVHKAILAANSYVAGSSFDGASYVHGGTIVEVAVTGKYPCVFLSIIGVSSLPIKESGAADVASVLAGEQQ